MWNPSSYARQFLGQMEKPNVDYITGLSPAISIDQKTTSRNPRSTVGTVTEIQDYLRILYARAGVPHCTKCGKPIERQSVDQMIEQIFALPEDSRLSILSPSSAPRRASTRKYLQTSQRAGLPGCGWMARCACWKRKSRLSRTTNTRLKRWSTASGCGGSAPPAFGFHRDCSKAFRRAGDCAKYGYRGGDAL